MLDVQGLLFWGPVALGAVVAAAAGFVSDRRRARSREQLLADGTREGRSRAQLRYFADVGDSSNA